MSDSQFITIVSLIMASIVINLTVLGLTQRSIHRRIDDVRGLVELLVSHFLPEFKVKKKKGSK